MATFTVKFVFLLSIIKLTLQDITCDGIEWPGSAVSFGTPHLYTLIANSSATIQDFLQYHFEQLEENHDETMDLLQSQTETVTRMADKQTQIAETQAQMTNTFGQVVNLLQNMSTTMNTMVSLLENQQETLENIAIQSLQSANTTALTDNANSRWRNVVEVLEIQGQQLQNLTTIMSKQLQFDHYTYLQIKPRDCSQIASYGDYPPGLYEIMLSNELHNVYCDGEWTVFQRRFDGSINFYHGWDDYQYGFGNLQTDGEFWLGLDKLHQMTQSGNWVLRVDLEDFNNATAYALYESFQIGDVASNYTLSFGSYSGTAGDSLSWCNNMQFSTHDRDNDAWDRNCADYRQAAWWYRHCGYSNLNGRYLGPSGNSRTGMVWYHWKNSWQSLKKSEMKIRRVQ